MLGRQNSIAEVNVGNANTILVLPPFNSQVEANFYNMSSHPPRYILGIYWDIAQRNLQAYIWLSRRVLTGRGQTVGSHYGIICA